MLGSSIIFIKHFVHIMLFLFLFDTKTNRDTHTFLEYVCVGTDDHICYYIKFTHKNSLQFINDQVD